MSELILGMCGAGLLIVSFLAGLAVASAGKKKAVRDAVDDWVNDYGCYLCKEQRDLVYEDEDEEFAS